MNITNYIESRHRELRLGELLDPEYISLYDAVENRKLREIFSSLHKSYISLFTAMNGRLPTKDFTSHYWAAQSRQLLLIIEITMGLLRALKGSKDEFEIEGYYSNLLISCQSFLSASGGSIIPKNMEKVELYYIVPIFTSTTLHKVKRGRNEYYYPISLIGEGSYALIYKYKDEYYNKHFALKRARKSLSEKERERFRREFEEMRQLSSPYVLEVYAFDEWQMEYIMEYADFSLDTYIQQNNNKITIELRKNLCLQIFKAFTYLHTKNLKHRDISPKNILLKQHEDILIVKVSDFGLVKTVDSTLTSVNTGFKGYFNDPSLVTEGFENYDTHHEVYALTKLVLFVMTGRTKAHDISDAKLNAFVQMGLNPDKTKRFGGILEMTDSFRAIFL